MDTRRNLLKKKQRVVIKIGSSSLQHTETGDMDYIRLEVLVRELCNLKIRERTLCSFRPALSPRAKRRCI